jgi:putative transposase
MQPWYRGHGGWRRGRRQPITGLLPHAERGSQEVCQTYQRRRHEAERRGRMNRPVACLEQAMAERFFGRLQRERTAHGLHATWQEARDDLIDALERFDNRTRKHSYLGWSSPNAYEALRQAASLSVRFSLTISVCLVR